MRGRELAKARRRFQIVFQDPYASLNPRMTVWATLAEPLKVHFGWDDAKIKARIQELLTVVGLSVGSEQHTSELQSLMRSSYAVFCLTNKTPKNIRSSVHPSEL